MKQYRVIWDTRAKESLKAIIKFIKEESPSAWRKVRVELLKLVGKRKCQSDFQLSHILSLRIMNNEYRSVSKWNYKIIYRVDETEVKILEIVHTKRNTTAIENVE